jgi:hypothetical protein
MKERPIIMSAESVRAILDERKTQTRRVIKSVRCRRGGQITEFGKSDTDGYDFHYRNRWAQWNDVSNKKMIDRCPYGAIGDRLWVRETWTTESALWDDDKSDAFFLQVLAGGERLIYKADDIVSYNKWRSPMFMPRWASRITLEITDIRIERLQDISEEDAITEGVDIESSHASRCIDIETAPYDNDLIKGSAILTVFKDHWNSLNVKRGYSWESNPWVWVISFKVVELLTEVKR